MPALNNPKHEMVAQAFIQTPIAKQAYSAVYPNASNSTAETSGPSLLRNPQVRNRIQEILEARGLNPESLIEYGEREFLRCEDKNIGFKAWRTFLELQGMINSEQTLSIAQIVFNEQITKSDAAEVCQPQDVVVQPITNQS